MKLTSKGVDRDKHMSDIGLCDQLLPSCCIGHSGKSQAHVDLLVKEPLLEILVDGLVRDRAQKSHVGDTGLLLLLEALGPVRLFISASSFH